MHTNMMRKQEALTKERRRLWGSRMVKWRMDGGRQTEEIGWSHIDQAAPHRDSAAAPSSTLGKKTLVIHLTPDEL